MKILLYFLWVFASLLAYVVLAISFGIDQRYPWIHILLAIGGIFLSVRALREKFTWQRLVSSLGSILLVLLFCWWVFRYSEYPENEKMAHSGQALALRQIERLDQEGQVHRLGELLAQPGPTLFVFYRGHW